MLGKISLGKLIIHHLHIYNYCFLLSDLLDTFRMGLHHPFLLVLVYEKIRAKKLNMVHGFLKVVRARTGISFFCTPQCHASFFHYCCALFSGQVACPAETFVVGEVLSAGHEEH